MFLITPVALIHEFTTCRLDGRNTCCVETKAGQIISISSIIGTVIFGFSAIVLSTSTVNDILNRIDETTRHVFSSIIIASMGSAIFSVIMGLWALKIQEYRFIFGSSKLSGRYLKKKKIINEFEKLKVRKELSKVKLTDFLKSIVRPEIRDRIPGDFTQRVTEYFKQEDDGDEDLDRVSTFEEFSKSKLPSSFKKILREYWNTTPLDSIMEDFLDDYARDCLANFAENDSKATRIQISYYLMVMTLALISIALALLFLSFVHRA